MDDDSIIKIKHDIFHKEVDELTVQDIRYLSNHPLESPKELTETETFKYLIREILESIRTDADRGLFQYKFKLIEHFIDELKLETGFKYSSVANNGNLVFKTPFSTTILNNIIYKFTNKGFKATVFGSQLEILIDWSENE